MNKKYLFLLPTIAVTIMTLVLCAAGTAVPQKNIGWVSTDIRFNINDNVDNFKLGKSASLTGWKGEEIYAQVVISSEEDIDGLRIVAGDLKSGKNIIPASAVKAGFVGYVMTDELNKDKKGACGHRISTDFDSSLVADPIDYNKAVKELKKNIIQPIWVKFNIPVEAAAGNYKGYLTVMNNDNILSKLAVDLKVSSRALPQENDFHLDLWQNPYAVARYYNVEPFSQEHFDLMRPIMKEYADAGGKVITTSIMHKPWNGQTYDPFESMVTWLKKADGTWWFDYTVFDKWVEFMMSLGVKKQISCYSMIPWKLSFQYIDQASNSFRFFHAKPGKPEYEEFWSEMLRSFATHLKEKGWFDITMIAMDERPMKQMLAAMEVIKNADPEFKISLAGNMHEELLDGLHDYCIPIEACYPEGAVEKRRKEGKVTTIYTSCAEAWPNTFTFSSPAEAEWIGWAVAAKGLDGYLRWAFNSWPKDPINDSRFTTWAAGDTYLIYPDAISSIRLERLKSGISAWRKIQVLKEEFNLSGNKKKLAELDKALELFNVPDKEHIVNIVTDTSRDKAAETVNAARTIINNL